MTIKGKAVLMVVAAAVLWSTGGFLIKWIDWTGLSIAGWRSLIAALFLCGCLRRAPRIPGSAAAWIGILMYSLMVLSFVMATKLTTAANAILLEYLSPVYVALLAPIFLKEPTRRRDWLFIVSAACGMAMFFMDELGAGGLAGNVLGVFSGIFFASFCLALRRVPAGHAVDMVVFGNVTAFLLSLPFMDFQHVPGASGWLCLLILGCFQLGLGYYFYAAASVHLTALELSVIPVLEPLLNPLIVALFLGETPGVWSMAGGVIVLGTVTSWAAIKAGEKRPGVV
ncbi:MAG: EamA family transporter [Deltaproteobacteria bacterium]|jgi:drug/metabolite transporter (DMT)-like permease|nr:EamA family transporter [Deltaproteobacteria bacterium]